MKANNRNAIFDTWFIYYCILALIVAGMVFLIHEKTASDLQAARNRYISQSHEASVIAQARTEAAFKQIYQNLRTISFLPSVETIDRHGTNLDDNANQSIQQIYNNLFSNVAVSEIYIVPVTLNADLIDPVTQQPEAPIISYDKLIVNGAGGNDSSDDLGPNKPEEVEIYEYRLLRRQEAWLRDHYPTNKDIQGLNVPFIGGYKVITCDNSVFNTTRLDSDRRGTILSVPFFGKDGVLKGTISAIIRINVLKNLIPSTDAALINTTYNEAIGSTQAGQERASWNWAQQGKPDPSLIYSETIPLSLNDPRSQWVVWFGHPDSDFYGSAEVRSIDSFEDGACGVVALLAILAAAILWGMKNLVIRPVTDLSAVVAEIADGALQVTVPSMKRSDYLGKMARSIDVFRTGLIENEQLRESNERQREQAERDRARALMLMADTVERETRNAVERLSTDTTMMADHAGKMAGSASAVGVNSQSVANAASQSLENAQIVAAASEQMRVSIQEISQQMSFANVVTAEAVKASSSAQQIISRLSTAVDKIGEVATLIRNIAEQTNLLALNATIEAARAGEAGKGFAVVAAEVKALANQTSQATEDIGKQIKEIRQTTAAAVDAVGNIGDRIRNVEEVSSSVASAVEEQSAATAEIVRNINETSTAVREVSYRITAVSSEADDTGRRATDVSTAATDMLEAVADMRTVLVRIVRTASEDADRRRSTRYALDLPAAILIDGHSVAGRLQNCSLGGASITGLSQSPAPGTRVSVTISGFAEHLPATVKGSESGMANLEFHLPESIRPRFEADFRQVTSRATPLNRAA